MEVMKQSMTAVQSMQELATTYNKKGLKKVENSACFYSTQNCTPAGEALRLRKANSLWSRIKSLDVFDLTGTCVNRKSLSFKTINSNDQYLVHKYTILTKTTLATTQTRLWLVPPAQRWEKYQASRDHVVCVEF